MCNTHATNGNQEKKSYFLKIPQIQLSGSAYKRAATRKIGNQILESIKLFIIELKK
jgi:hypothetical protein